MSQFAKSDTLAHSLRIDSSQLLPLLLLLLLLNLVGGALHAWAEWVPGNPTIPGTYTESVTLDINSDGIADVRFDPQGEPGTVTFLLVPIFSYPFWAMVFYSSGDASRFESRDEILGVPQTPQTLTHGSVTLPASLLGSPGYVGFTLFTQSSIPGGDHSERAYFLIETTPTSLTIIESGVEPLPLTGIGDTSDTASSWLGQAAPNPLVASSRIFFGLSRDGEARVDLFDAAGRRVKRLFDGHLPKGEHAVFWNGKDEQSKRVASGTYFYRLSAEGRMRCGRLVVAH